MIVSNITAPGVGLLRRPHRVSLAVVFHTGGNG